MSSDILTNHENAQANNDALFNQSWSGYQPHGLLWAVEQRFHHILPLLINYQQDALLIDFGCGDGSFIHVLKRLGLPFKCIGVDSSIEAIARAQQNTSPSYSPDVIFKTEWANDESIRSGITIVSSLHVLEHVADPLGMLKSVTNKCDLVLLEVPIEGGYIEKIKSKRMIKANDGFHPWGHINFWMPGEFIELVHKAGLVPIYSYEYAPTLYGEPNPYNLSLSSLKRFLKQSCWKIFPKSIYREIYSSFFFVAAIPMNVGQRV